MLLIGFAGAMRRSELSALDAAGVAETGEGLRISVGRSKTDREGGGATVGITYGSNPPTCPVRAWRAWVGAAGIAEGPAFRNLRNGRVTGSGSPVAASPAWSSAGPPPPAWLRSLAGRVWSTNGWSGVVLLTSGFVLAAGLVSVLLARSASLLVSGNPPVGA